MKHPCKAYIISAVPVDSDTFTVTIQVKDAEGVNVGTTRDIVARRGLPGKEGVSVANFMKQVATARYDAVAEAYQDDPVKLITALIDQQAPID